MHPRLRLLTATAGALCLGQIAASASMRPGFALTCVTDLISALLLGALLLGSAANALHTHERLRSVWILITAGWSLWLADQGGWILYDVVLRKPIPTMFPGDVLLFLAGVPVLAALLLRPHVEPSRRSTRLGILDFLQLMLWWIYCYAYVVTTWEYVSPNAALYNRNFDTLYILQFLALIVCLVFLWKQSASAWRMFYTWFLACVLFSYGSTIIVNRAIEAGVYQTGSWYDVFLVTSLTSFVIVIIKGRTLTPLPESAGTAAFDSSLFSLSAAAILSLPVIIVYSIYKRPIASSVVQFRVLLSSMATLILTTLVLVKQRRMHQELTKSNRDLEEASLTDPLTGIRNRRFFSTVIESDIARSLRIPPGDGHLSRDICFYLIDIDNFKEINDRFGHDAGDRVLMEAARRINTIVRSSDTFLRWGGEEFLIVSRFTDRQTANVLAHRVLKVFRSEPFTVSPSELVWRTCSVGWAAFPWIVDDAAGLGYQEVLKCADQALNHAKRSGKNQAIGAIPGKASTHSRARYVRVEEPMTDGC